MTTPTIETLRTLQQSEIARKERFPTDALKHLEESLKYQAPYSLPSQLLPISEVELDIETHSGVEFTIPNNHTFPHLAPALSTHTETHKEIHEFFGIRMEQPRQRFGSDSPLIIMNERTKVEFYLKETALGKPIGKPLNGAVFEYAQDLRRLVMGLMLATNSEFNIITRQVLWVREMHRYSTGDHDLQESLALPAGLLAESLLLQPMIGETRLESIPPEQLVLINPTKLKQQTDLWDLNLNRFQQEVSPFLLQCYTP
jgi:hypothetical protein